MKTVKSILKYIAISVLGFLLSPINISLSSYINTGNSEKIDFFAPVIKKLIKKGVDTIFIYDIINDTKTKFNDRFVKINVTGYLKKPDYSSHYNDLSTERTKSFINDNIELLQECESKYGVPKEIIASVLWVETRHGNYLGDNHVPSVFLSTAMASEDEYIEMNLEELRKTFDGNNAELKELEKKIIRRARSKSDWAIDELVSLSKMYGNYPGSIKDIHGSWAGAFGMSQFLPSSYVALAVDGDGDGLVDLFNLADAAHSVANYLKENGWSQTDSNLQKKAIYSYNNSSAYVEAILKLAENVTIAEENTASDEIIENEIIDHEEEKVKIPLHKQIIKGEERK
jgi:membrane-bound lytic murein transglycosylase B